MTLNVLPRFYESQCTQHMQALLKTLCDTPHGLWQCSFGRAPKAAMNAELNVTASLVDGV